MAPNIIDETRPPREGEELNAPGLKGFLRDSIPGLSDSIKVSQFPGGHSNLTYLLTFGDRQMVLRRPPFGTKAKSAHDMGREYRVLSALHSAFPYAPRPLAYTEDESILGCPFYVMERIVGTVIRKSMPDGLVLSEDQKVTLLQNLVKVHHELHSVDYKAVGLAEFGKPEGYVRRQVEGWSKRYRNARTPDAPDCERVMEWLAEKMPPESGDATIIHNDFKLDNVVLDPSDPLKIIGVLDWEMATLGDPFMDLGSSMAYWTNKDDPDEMAAMPSMPVEIRGTLSRRQVIELYGKLSGRKIDNFDFYYVFGLFRLGVIAQQIYYRYYHGQTKDERFKVMIFGVIVVDNQAQRVIDATNL